MDKVTIITDNENIEHALIDHGNGEFTSMPKSVYEEMLANQPEVTQ
jgi:predicted aspartyl protease